MGICDFNDLRKEPYATWFTANEKSYEPNPIITSQLKKFEKQNLSIKIVFGSWCGDSKREVPRMAKLLSEVSFPTQQMQLIGVSDSSAFYKQSPTHEEVGLNVYRVPTFIIYRKGKEIGRINEYAVESLERDLMRILKGEDYEPNYRSFIKINQWLETGLLIDPNVSTRGLASQVKALVSSESELNSCGYVLLGQGKMTEAITLFRMNANLFPQSANVFDSLGEAYALTGEKQKALQAYERALHLDPQSENARAQIEKLKAM